MAQQIDVSLDGLHEIQNRIEQKTLKESDWPVLGALLSNFVSRQESRIARMVNKISANQATTGTEKVCDPAGAEAQSGDGDEDCPPSPLQDNEPPNSETSATNDPNGKAKGHGRNGASAFTNAQHFLHGLTAGIIGSLCEVCRSGRMTKYREKVIIRIVGQPIFGAAAPPC